VYKKKVEGAFIHSKRKWLEEGEQNSHYFFSLERRNFVSNTINKLNIDGFTTDDHTVISQYCSEFFNNLYTSSYSQVTADAFLNSLQIKPIEKHERESCDKPITISELLEAISHLKNSKSPGTDGLTSELYKLFSKELAPFLVEVFAESIERQFLPPTLTQG